MTHPITAPRLATWALAAALASTGSCTPKPATQVIVELHAEPELLTQASSLHVTIVNDEGETVLDRTSAITPAGERLARIPLIPRGDDPSRTFVVRAELLDSADSLLVQLEARAGYVEQELRVLELYFESACSGKLDCEAGRTCFEGRCVGSCFTPRPAEQPGRSRPDCGECQRCNGSCEAADGIACGCPGETCSAGACVPSVRVSNVGAGSVHTCAAVEGGDVYCWGSTTFDGNLSGQKGRLGTGDAGQDSPTPVLVNGARGRHGVIASGNFTCTFDGNQRYCWGLNFKSEFGGDVGSVVSEPHVFDQGFEFEALASGFRHACGIDAANELFCWGYNERGNIGLGNTDDPIPVPTSVGTGYVTVAAGGDHTCSIDATGKLFCWGYNDSGEVGVAGEQIVTSAVRPGCEPGSDQNCFDDWKVVGAGAFHTCGIRASGQLYCWGGNQNGQVGIGPPTTSFQVREPAAVHSSLRFGDVAGGRSYTCALDSEGALYCWGLNEDRQLGIPDVDFIGVPTKVQVEAPGGWRALGLGQYHGCAVRADRTLWCWGRNSAGQVGIGAASEAPVDRPRRVCFD